MVDLIFAFCAFSFGFFYGGFVFGEDIAKWRARRRKWKKFVDRLNEDGSENAGSEWTPKEGGY